MGNKWVCRIIIIDKFNRLWKINGTTSFFLPNTLRFLYLEPRIPNFWTTSQRTFSLLHEHPLTSVSYLLAKLTYPLKNDYK
ncbi:hypothetical protein GCM10008967_18950 [Bacillus carboniphilus]|uniref:Uncharacterized protein n=1 Tax=Bacillus carboniphilus TaxID=86663 RepID=A0ABN0W8A6_9BACI